MKFRTLLISAVTLFSLQAKAQTTAWVADSVQMSAGYANDVFYSFKNGATGSPVSNTNWHLGFEMIPGGPGFGGVSVIANHTQGGVKVFSLHTTGTAKFATLAAADTASKTPLYNADSSWDWGAFNVNTNGSVFNYGWGTYNSTTHYVDGDSLYMIYAGGSVYKMVITHYHSYPTADIYYAFHIAKFDGSGDHLDTIRKSPDYMNSNFAYFNLTTNAIVNREPDNRTWDVAFTRYMDYKAGPPGAPYPTTGVLSNNGVMVADVRVINPDTSHYAGRTFTKTLNEIGFDWKVFVMPSAGAPYYRMDTTANFFVKTIVDTGAVYQLKFTAFDYTIGKVVFAKRLVYFPNSVGNVANHIAAHALVPNPASNNADLVIEAKEAATATLVITDITGKVLQNTPVSLNSGLNALGINTANYTTGTYMVMITNGTWKITEKLVVQH